jgi:hypothetical protein
MDAPAAGYAGEHDRIEVSSWRCPIVDLVAVRATELNTVRGELEVTR